MESREYDKSSWHYRIATTYGSRSKWAGDTDICEYTKQVLFGALMIFFIITIGAFALNIPANFIIWLIVSLKMGMFLSPEPPATAFIVLVIIAIISYVVSLIFNFFRTANEKGGQRPFIVEAYRSIKEEYCFKINFK